MRREIDLRSDTVTLPPPPMREAIARAEVGDDVYGEDPTVSRLEALAAERLAKEAAILLPSGTMANLLALMAHCRRGRKVLVGDTSDVWRWEAGGASVLGGLVLHPLPTQHTGELAIEDLAAAIEDDDDPQCAPAGLICLEDTHCLSGGRVLSFDYLARVRAFARERGLPVHLDGARIFNAAVAMEVEVNRISAFVDTVSFCLSKGLAAPVGSMVVGSAHFIAAVRRLRKMAGGAMRQAGFIAAAGIYGLEAMTDRLRDDHANAALLAQGLGMIPGIEVSADPPQTNIVFWQLADPWLDTKSFIAALVHEQVRVAELGKGNIRAVTHYGVDREDIETAVAAVQRALVRCRDPRGCHLSAAGAIDRGASTIRSSAWS
jgi:threonine aldolase